MPCRSLLGLILGALETRYRAFVFIGAGLPDYDRALSAAANPINFAAYLRAPKLIIQGRYDEDTPLRTATEPFFKLLSEPKRLTLYDGGHVPSIEVLMSSTRAWLDEYLGRVVRSEGRLSRPFSTSGSVSASLWRQATAACRSF